MSKAEREKDKAESAEKLRQLLPPGTKVYTVLRHVSASGMSRRIDLYTIRDNEPRFLSGYVAAVLEYKRHRDGGLIVGGAGMDMGFHLVHNLGYALWGGLARAEGRAGTAVRKRLAAATCSKHHAQDREGKELDPTKPAHEWFCAAGYAFRHDWI